jgi:hypothetical protein
MATMLVAGVQNKLLILGRAPGIATMKGSGMLAIGLKFDGEGIVTTKRDATRGRGRHHGWNRSKARG